MARHFLGLYLLIFATLAAVSWAQDKLWQRYGTASASEDKALSVAAFALDRELHSLPITEWKHFLAEAAATSGVGIELLATSDITGSDIVAKLKGGSVARMQASAGQSWVLKRINDDYVLALKSVELDSERSPLDWALTVLFYSAIALVIMIWLWPLRRDLRTLEMSAGKFGNRNWAFDVDVKPGSQVFPLVETFRKMAARIDGLIASHKDMSNALSHEIRTPLARMQFEIELALTADNAAGLGKILGNLKGDITAIDNLVTATLNYAILERADMALQWAEHNFAVLIPAVAQTVRRDTRPELVIATEIHSGADTVACDAHLLETALKNLLYNAARYAKHEIRVTFSVHEGGNHLRVDDDGPGIAPQDRQRVFESFVRMDQTPGKKTGFGLGLAIVKRIVELHQGEITLSRSPLGGARFTIQWPTGAR